MIPLQVELQRAVKATKDEAMTVEQAAELLKVHPDYIPVLVAKSDDLKMMVMKLSLQSVIRQTVGSSGRWFWFYSLQSQSAGNREMTA